MEEVDKIILETLRALKCDISEEIISLKQFNDDIVVLSVATCLETIIPSSKFPKKLSPSMAFRLKTASYLAEQIKDIGFKGELGYQTILYFNEAEIRKLFVFLLEKLPRDSDGSVQIEEIGYIPKLLGILKHTIKQSPHPWLPTVLLNRGTHFHEQLLEVRSYGESYPLKIKKLKLFHLKDYANSKNYLFRISPAVTKQCVKQKLIPSLIFEDCKFSKKNRRTLIYLKRAPIVASTCDYIADFSGNELHTLDVSNIEQKSTVSQTPSNLVCLESDNHKNSIETIEIEEHVYENLRKIFDVKRSMLSKLIEKKEEEMQILQEKQLNLELKNKTKAILSKEENLGKLKLLIDKAKSRMRDSKIKWEEVQKPIRAELESLNTPISDEKSTLSERKDELRNMITIHQDLSNDFKVKVDLERKLTEKHKLCSKTTNRSTYTKNIMEIIGNTKKQNYEMQKILKDNREIQKDINSLTGQIDRSFTIVDEYVFSNARKDETSKIAYKLLVSLHHECGEIVEIVSEIGFVDRECRNLRELIDNETARETIVKLKRLNKDLELIRSENLKLTDKL